MGCHSRAPSGRSSQVRTRGRAGGRWWSLGQRGRTQRVERVVVLVALAPPAPLLELSLYVLSVSWCFQDLELESRSAVVPLSCHVHVDVQL